MTTLDEAIVELERLYRTVTGQELTRTAASAPYAPIPAEKDPSEYVHQQVDRLCEMLVAAPFQTVAREPPVVPAMSVWSTEKEYVFQLEMPGVARDRTHVEVSGRNIHVTGQRELPDRGSTWLLTAERPLGSAYQRVFPLPLDADGSDLVAQTKDGVLEIRVHKRAAEASKVVIQ